MFEWHVASSDRSFAITLAFLFLVLGMLALTTALGRIARARAALPKPIEQEPDTGALPAGWERMDDSSAETYQHVSGAVVWRRSLTGEWGWQRSQRGLNSYLIKPASTRALAMRVATIPLRDAQLVKTIGELLEIRH